MLTIRWSLVAAISALLMLTACQDQSTPEPAAQAPSPPAERTVEPAPEPSADNQEIAWYDGSVEEAFALAKAENKPLFLYWGAVWCPPCVEIKQTVLKSPQFIAQSQLFVPVYLDGDTDRAQTWGDTFDAKVYPTMIVFNPAGQEVTRLHAGIDISAYNTVLELSLDSMQPTSELVQVALRDAGSLSDSDLQRLAYYSWYDDDRAAPDGVSPAMFLNLSEMSRNTNPEASARFYLQYLSMLESTGESAAADPTRVLEILGSPELRFACWDYLTSDATSIMAGLGSSTASMEGLQNAWARTLIENRHDERLSTAKQMSAWGPYLDFHAESAADVPLPADVAAAILADGRAADEKTSGTHSRQSVIDTVADIYMNAGLIDEARDLLRAEIENSRLPYYFMSALAHLEEQQDNTVEAVEWRRKAYEASTGPATRIRWWSRYVQAQVRMAPQDIGAVQQAALAIFDDESVAKDAFAGANFRNFEKATSSLQQWAQEPVSDKSLLGDYSQRLSALCVRQDENSTERENCNGLVESLVS